MKKMKTKETKQFIRWCILGAIGCGLMAAGDWLLGLSLIHILSAAVGVFVKLHIP